MSGTDPIPLHADLRTLATRGLADTLGIELVELSPSRVVATMPVNRANASTVWNLARRRVTRARGNRGVARRDSERRP